jgi:hypothetical protein
MGRIENMVDRLSTEIQRLGVSVIGSEIADERHGCIITNVPPKDGARRLSTVLPGMVFIGSSHISWASGSYAVAVHTGDTWERLQPVRMASQAITGEPGRFGVGACARHVAAWLGPPEPTNPRLRQYVGDWHYQRCRPCQIPQAYQFDLSACYFNLLRRVPTLRPVFAGDDVFWLHTDDSEAARFARLVDAVSDCKQLRNALIGAFYGGSEQTYLRQGKAKRFRTAPGSRAGLAAVIVRTAYEITQMQADLSDAAYANTDSVISECDRAGFWSDIGMPYVLGAAGPANIQAIGKYCVGEKKTKTFLADKTGTLRSARESRRFDTSYWRWLTTETPLLS